MCRKSLYYINTNRSILSMKMKKKSLYEYQIYVMYVVIVVGKFNIIQVTHEYSLHLHVLMFVQLQYLGLHISLYTCMNDVTQACQMLKRSWIGSHATYQDLKATTHFLHQHLYSRRILQFIGRLFRITIHIQIQVQNSTINPFPMLVATGSFSPKNDFLSHFVLNLIIINLSL